MKSTVNIGNSMCARPEEVMRPGRSRNCWKVAGGGVVVIEGSRHALQPGVTSFLGHSKELAFHI